MTTWTTDAQAGGEDTPYALGSHIAQALREFAEISDLQPKHIIEALPVVIVQVLDMSVKDGLKVGDLWETLLPFINEQIRAVDWGKVRK